MPVEVNQTERPVHASQRAQLGQRHAVVTAYADADDAGLGDPTNELLDSVQRLLDVAGTVGASP